MAETTNETASIRIVRGAVKTCTSHLARPNPLNSATEALAESLLLPSINWSRPIRDERLVVEYWDSGAKLALNP